VDIALGSLLNRAALLVQGGLPDPDTEGMGLVDRLLAVLERKALSITSLLVILIGHMRFIPTVNITTAIRLPYRRGIVG
jgi:hypothetical protein